MTKALALVILVILVSQFAYPQAPESKAASLKLGYVKNAADGCGCSFSYNLAEFWKDKHLFVSPMDEASFINVDGQDVELRPISQSKENMDAKVGDRSWETYVAGDLKVRLDYTVTKTCDPNDENCEVTYYRARMTVMRGKQRRIVNGVALCGC